MTVVDGFENIKPNMRGGAVALGVFDGVHWGHQTIFHDLIRAAEDNRTHSLAVTFNRHPIEFLAPSHAPEYICTLDQRLELMAASGVDVILVAEFHAALAGLTHEEFLHSVLRETLGAVHIVVGSNFLFGAGRRGDIRFLQTEGPKLGVGVRIVSSVIIDGAPVSSTRIRSMIGEGDVTGASRLLGRRFTLRGKVVTGRSVGRSLGFPTANLEVAPRQALPANGVYAVESAVDGTVYHGLCSIGVRPTFGAGEVTIEVHLVGFEGDLYGRILDVTFVRHIREQLRFDTTEQLVAQMRLDLNEIRDAA